MNHGYEFDRETVKERKRYLAAQRKRAKERVARKRLEAAAPDLLAACKADDEWLRNNIKASNRPAKLDQLRIAAIAAAKE